MAKFNPNFQITGAPDKSARFLPVVSKTFTIVRTTNPSSFSSSNPSFQEYLIGINFLFYRCRMEFICKQVRVVMGVSLVEQMFNSSFCSASDRIDFN